MVRSKYREWCYFKLHITTRDQAIDDEIKIDRVTWIQWINSALRRSHGLFGEGCEYVIMNEDDKIAYVRVNHRDSDMFASAISVFTSSEELVGHQLTCSIIQQTPLVQDLKISDDDELWLKKELEENEN